ncbi:hypothetical protein DFH28DRAFT_161161 [Melampsora americana]|nr:hypothetical protein DFH28DRAFT_161161 [Melampsora americana]
MKRKRNKDDEGPHQIRSLLSSYYPTTMSLWQLLQLDDNDDADLDPLKSYLVGLQVLPHKGSDQPSRDKGLFQKCAPRAQTDDAEPEITMAQVIDAAQTHLLWSSSRPSAKDMGSKQNVLTIGCRMNHQDLPSFVVPVIGPYANNLVSKHMTIENTLNNFLIKSFAFSALLKRLMFAKQDRRQSYDRATCEYIHIRTTRQRMLFSSVRQAAGRPQCHRGSENRKVHSAAYGCGHIKKLIDVLTS